jgi:small nuclear ribonucleoprotein (snRNP)-like protein
MNTTIDIRDIKYNQVITVELKNGQFITGHFRGVSKVVNNELEITDRKIVNLAPTTVDSKQPEASILSNLAVNCSQVVRYSVNEEYADKVMKAMWQRSLDQVAAEFNKIDWSKFDESLTMKEVEA